VTKDDYVFIDVTWTTKFKHSVPCRGFNFKSTMKSIEELDYVTDISPRIVTQEEYETYIHGDDDGPTEQRIPQQENPPKRSRAKAKSKDSESTRDSGGKPPRTTGSQPSKLLKSTVRNVSKSKKDIQRTNNPGTKGIPKPGRTTRKTK
jgi:hypothetical protein